MTQSSIQAHWLYYMGHESFKEYHGILMVGTVPFLLNVDRSENARTVASVLSPCCFTPLRSTGLRYARGEYLCRACENKALLDSNYPLIWSRTAYPLIGSRTTGVKREELEDALDWWGVDVLHSVLLRQEAREWISGPESGPPDPSEVTHYFATSDLPAITKGCTHRARELAAGLDSSPKIGIS